MIGRQTGKQTDRYPSWWNCKYSNIKRVFSKISEGRKAAYLHKKENQINIKFFTDADTRRQWNSSFRVLRERDFKFRVSYPDPLPLECEGKVKI